MVEDRERVNSPPVNNLARPQFVLKRPWGMRPLAGQALSLPRNASTTIQVVFWTVALLIQPLALHPGLLGLEAVAALSQLHEFRALVMLGTLLLGIVVFLLTAPVNLGELLLRSVRGLLPMWSYPMLGLIIWLVVTGPFGNVAPSIPGIGSSDRMAGAYSMACWFGLLLVSSAIARYGHARSTFLLWLAVCAGLITSVWALLQGLNKDPLTWLSTEGVFFDIPAAAFGHGALASAFVVFVSLLFVFNRLANESWRSTDAFVTLILGVGISSAGGRAALGGLFGAATFLLVRTMVHKRGASYLLRHLAVLAVAITATALVLPRTQAQALNAVAAMQGQDPSLNYRFPAWRTGLKVVAANPLLGVGAGGFAYAAWNFTTPADEALLIEGSVLDTYGTHNWLNEKYQISGNVLFFYDEPLGQMIFTSLGWDKAHNYLLDVALTAGVPAAVLFIAATVAILQALWRSSIHFSKGVAVGLGAFLIFGLAWFPTIGLDPVIWTLVGAGLGLAKRTPGERPTSGAHTVAATSNA